MIIDLINKTCELTDEDRKKIGDIDCYITRPIVNGIIEDIREDLERGIVNGHVRKDNVINAEGLFDMAYEMFETCYYGYIKDCAMDVLHDIEIRGE